MVNLHLNDNQYPNEGINHIRRVSRAILVDESNQIFILKIYGNDIFGLRDYYETPGGGVDENESFEEAVIREIDEEVGVKCHIEMYLGEIVDYYNLIKRKNINHYFLCRVDQITKIHHKSFGDSLIQKIEKYSLEELIDKYEKMSDHGVSKLVKQRELPILLDLKYMKDNKLLQL